MHIPIVDLAMYKNGSVTERKQFVDLLGHSFEHVGFVSVKNHGIPSSLIRNLYDITKQFFSLPHEVKISYEIPHLHGQRGYTSFGKEHAKGSPAPDLKEFFQFGQLPNDTEPYPSNVQVAEIVGFNDCFEEAFSCFEKSGFYLLQAISDYLHLPLDFFSKQIQYGNSILRAIHYPPILCEPESSIRAEQHEDINLITLLVGASAEGLQILSKNNEWLPVVSSPDQIVVNVGDMLQRLTNDLLKSTTHRVINPPRDQWHTSRFSIPFFLHPVSQMSLACLDSCISDHLPKRYEDLTAGQYLDERLKEIGLKK